MHVCTHDDLRYHYFWVDGGSIWQQRPDLFLHTMLIMMLSSAWTKLTHDTDVNVLTGLVPFVLGVTETAQDIYDMGTAGGNSFVDENVVHSDVFRRGSVPKRV
jgi:hypothetical protein